MGKPIKRPAIPKALREAVLREFNHRCAICGSDRPQVHHIDEDPFNNVSENLLPLCPNCHLTDQHNPTAPVDTEKLWLFRKFKDPAILCPQFEPLFARCRFLSRVEQSDSAELLEERGGELADFVVYLKMGGFYSERIQELLKRPARGRIFILNAPPDPAEEEEDRRFDEEYREQLRRARDAVYAIVVELLRYQDWAPRRGV